MIRVDHQTAAITNKKALVVQKTTLKYRHFFNPFKICLQEKIMDSGYHKYYKPDAGISLKR